MQDGESSVRWGVTLGQSCRRRPIANRKILQAAIAIETNAPGSYPPHGHRDLGDFVAAKRSLRSALQELFGGIRRLCFVCSVGVI
jgi:hypothetical protein